MRNASLARIAAGNGEKMKIVLKKLAEGRHLPFNHREGVSKWRHQMNKDKSKPQYLVSVFRQEGEWDSQGIKTLREMGFSQELDVNGKAVATPHGVFVKYDRSKDPSELRDKIMDKIEDNISTPEGERVYVVVSDDLVPLMVKEMKSKGQSKDKSGETNAGKHASSSCDGKKSMDHDHKKHGGCGCGCGH